MEQNPVSVETTFCPLTANEDIAFRDPRLALDGHVQFTSSEADRIGGTSLINIDDEPFKAVELMPTMRSPESTSGPPLLPGLMGEWFV